jgi:agmatinase
MTAHQIESKEIIGVGVGVSGRFCGLPDQYSNKNSKVVLIPVPFDLTTTYLKGSDLGPAALIEASRSLELYDIETDSEVYKVGIETKQAVVKNSSAEMLKAVYEEVKDELSRGRFVVTLGGEHSISQAPIKAHVEKFPGLSVLQFDAHADLQMAYDGDPYSHASVMARVHEIPNIGNIISVGIRSMSHEEKPFMDRKKTFMAQDIYNNDKWIDQVISQLSDQVYITFDLDAFDPSIMPSTGTPEPGGLDWYLVLKLIKRLAKEREIVGLDVVELLPNPSNSGPDFLAAKLLYKILSYIYKK